jgi:serine/threonine protein kinase
MRTSSVSSIDVKPENIVVTPDMETAYLVDFGIALSGDEAKRLTGTDYVIRSPGYMSPEQASSERINQSRVRPVCKARS